MSGKKNKNKKINILIGIDSCRYSGNPNTIQYLVNNFYGTVCLSIYDLQKCLYCDKTPYNIYVYGNITEFENLIKEKFKRFILLKIRVIKDISYIIISLLNKNNSIYSIPYEQIRLEEVPIKI